MYKFLLIIKLAVLSAITTHSQTFAHDFQKEFQWGTDQLVGNVMTKTADGGFVVVSSVQRTTGTTSQEDIILFKLDSNYELVFERRYNTNEIGSIGFYALDVIERSRGGYAICGYIAPTTEATTGGFLLQLKSNGTIESFKFYPTDPSLSETIIRVDKVLESDFGYIMLGTGVDQTSQNRGLIMSTFPNGDILWSYHIFDQQYTIDGKVNQNSFLYDLARGKKNEFVAVGSVNGQPSADSDIIVVKFTEYGFITGNWVYERQGKVFGDGQQAFLDAGTTITYNYNRNTLLVAGISLQANEANCSVADNRRLLTFEIDYPSGNVNWSTTHDFDPTQFPDRVFNPYAIIYNPNLNEYAICGYRSDNIFNPGGMQNHDGFIFRLDGNGLAKETSIYGESTNEFFYSIEAGTITDGYTVCGNKNGKCWMVESYKNITDKCQQEELLPVTSTYPLQSHWGSDKLFTIHQKELPVKLMLAGIKGEIICERNGVSIDPDPWITEPGFRGHTSSTSENPKSYIYPTVAQNHINIVNNDKYDQYRIYAINGGKVIKTAMITEGRNRIEFDHLNKGLYIIQLANSEQTKSFKFTIN